MKTGLFFGSFNPIHIGHLAIASFMTEFTDLGEVWFVVSPQNPLKNKESLLDDRLRLEMVELAISDDARFNVCDIEFSLPQPSFTIDTMNRLEELYPERAFSIIMGSDGLVTFSQWKKHEEIIRRFKRYVYPRPATPESFLSALENGVLVPAPQLEISSTFIRESIETGKDVRYFLTEPVREFLFKHQLYTKNK